MTCEIWISPTRTRKRTLWFLKQSEHSDRRRSLALNGLQSGTPKPVSLTVDRNFPRWTNQIGGCIKSDIGTMSCDRRVSARITRDNRWNSRRPRELAIMRPREPRIPLRFRGTNSLRCSRSQYLGGVLYCRSPARERAGRPRIIELAQASDARFVHMVYGSWPILGCTADTRPMERSE